MLFYIIFYCGFVAAEVPKIEGTAGKDVSLECTIDGSFELPEWHGPPNFTIYNKQGKTMFNSVVPGISEGRLSWNEDNKRDLVIRPVKKIDEGYYQCFVFGIGEYRLNLLVTGTVENVTNAATPRSSNTAIIIGIAILVLWISICTLGIIFLQTKCCKWKHMKIKSKLNTILLVISCYFVVGWVIGIYTAMFVRPKGKADTNHEIKNCLLRMDDPLPQQTNIVVIETKPQQNKTGIAAPSVTAVETDSQDEDEARMHDQEYQLSENDLRLIPKHIGKIWKPLAVPFNISQDTLEQIQKCYSNKDHIYHMLVHWRETEGVKANKASLLRKINSVQGVTVNWELLSGLFEMTDCPQSVTGTAIDFNVIDVKWKAPPVQPVHGAIKRYRVYCTKIDDKSGKTTKLKDVDCTETTLTNLEASMTYSIQVRAFYSAIWSKLSESCQVKTCIYTDAHLK